MAVAKEKAHAAIPARRRSCGTAWNNGTWNPKDVLLAWKGRGTHPWMPPCHRRQTSHPKCRIVNVPWQPLHPFQINKRGTRTTENKGNASKRPRPRPRCGAEMDCGHRPPPPPRRRRTAAAAAASNDPRPRRKKGKEKETQTNAKEDIDRPTNVGEEVQGMDSCVPNPCVSPSNSTNWCVDCCPRKKRRKGKLGPSTSCK